MANVRRFYLDLATKGPDSILSWGAFLGLYPFSLIYSIFTWCRAKAYTTGLKSSYKSSVPVISVGNLTAGGTGKTPVVDAVVKYCLSQAYDVAVVSRGYKGSLEQDCCRVTEEHTPNHVGDEPYLLAKRNPKATVYVSPKRRLGVKAAEADGVDCIILDDGFQHLAVQRNLDIVLLDERSPFGNGTVLPSGYLREPKSSIKRAGLIIQTHSSFSDKPIVEECDVAKCRHNFTDLLIDADGQDISWKQLDGKICMAFAGIAHPEGFFNQLRGAGCDLLETLELTDHQDYSSEILKVINRASKNVDYLLTTEKDFVKLDGTKLDKPCLAVPMTLDFDDFGIVTKSLEKVLGGRDA